MTPVGVNMLWCLPGEVGGSEQYITRLLPELAEQDPDLDVLLFVLPGFAEAHPALAAQYEMVLAPVSGRRRPLRVAAERTWLAREVRRRRLSLLHHPGGTAPPARHVPIVLSMHDIQYVTYPEHFSTLKRRWLAHAVPAGLRRASVVTTPSTFVKQTVVEAYDIEPSRVVVVPHGLPADFPPTRAATDSDVLARHGLRSPFVVYPAATYPHKNHRLLLDALRLLPESSDVQLVLIGGQGRAETAVRERIGELGLSCRVVRAGRVDDADRDRLLRRAEALVFPSRYEGFGAPVLEAFALGTPVIAANATALPEVVGGAGILLDPDDPAAWADAIDQVRADPGLRARLVSAGRVRAAELTAARSAAALIGAYRRALSDPVPALRAGVSMRLMVLCPHFTPDPAPTGEVIGRIVEELAERGHELHVVSALPWYLHHSVEPEWRGRPMRRDRTAWGTVTRVHPFPSDKTSIPLRAVSFAAFCGLAEVAALPGGRMDGVLAMSPPLPLGLVGWGAALVHRAPLVFNVQDIFPDVAVQLGKLTDHRLVRAAERLERTTYDRAAAITVLSEDLQANVVAKVRPSHRDAVRVIPNFVDTDFIKPLDRLTAYRRELAIGPDQTVVLYAGNVGFSQSLDLVVGAARQLCDRKDVVFVINGGGSGLPELMASSEGLPNLRFAPYQPRGRLPEVLATGDVHVVPLRKGLATSSVPSKTYSTLAAGRPLLAAIDAGTEVARVVADARCGIAVPPDDAEAFVGALVGLLDDRADRAAMGQRGRAWVERWVSPAAVARAYEDLFVEVGRAG